MKYVAIYDLGNVRSAFCFDTYNAAVDYINSCSKYADQYMIKMVPIDNRHHEMILMNGRHMYIHIEEFPDSKVRFDLSYEENGKHIETRRFTKRHLAVDYAHKVLKEDHNYSADKKEDELGEWSVDNPKSKFKTHIKLNLVIIDEIKIAGPDYDILGIEPTASLNKVKRAYRRKAIKHHPDKGGDPEKFKIVNEAYERIMSGKAAKTGTKQVIKAFSNTDMRFVFKNFKNMQNRLDSILSTQSDIVFREMRDKGTVMIIVGSASMIIGTGLALVLSGIVPSIVTGFLSALVFAGFIILAIGANYRAKSKNYIDDDL